MTVSDLRISTPRGPGVAVIVRDPGQRRKTGPRGVEIRRSLTVMYR